MLTQLKFAKKTTQLIKLLVLIDQFESAKID